VRVYVIALTLQPPRRTVLYCTVLYCTVLCCPFYVLTATGRQGDHGPAAWLRRVREHGVGGRDGVRVYGHGPTGSAARPNLAQRGQHLHVGARGGAAGGEVKRDISDRKQQTQTREELGLVRIVCVYSSALLLACCVVLRRNCNNYVT
jgi:hypothetical protein